MDDTSGRPTNRDPLDAIVYEMGMLDYCFERLGNDACVDDREHEAILEAYLVHYRNLIEFFGTPARRSGDLRLARIRDWIRRPLAPQAAVAMADMGRALRQEFADAISLYLEHSAETRYLRARDWPLGLMHERLWEVRRMFSGALTRPPP